MTVLQDVSHIDTRKTPAGTVHPTTGTRMGNKHRIQVRIRERITGTLMQAGTAWVEVTDGGVDIAVEHFVSGAYDVTLVSSPAGRIESLISVENEIAGRRHADSREVPNTAAGG